MRKAVLDGDLPGCPADLSAMPTNQPSGLVDGRDFARTDPATSQNRPRAMHLPKHGIRQLAVPGLLAALDKVNC
jgi:hypothetical protein